MLLRLQTASCRRRGAGCILSACVIAPGYAFAIPVRDPLQKHLQIWILRFLIVGGDQKDRLETHRIGLDEPLDDALQRFEAPDIFDAEQGSQFTSEAFTDVLKKHPIAIGMDGKGRWVDNVFVERLWRSVKYEDVYLRAYETPTELRTGLARYFDFYNTRRRHSALDQRTSDAVYFDQANRNLAA